MNSKIIKILSGAAAVVLAFGIMLLGSTSVEAKPKANVTVDVTVTVHGSDVGVSTEAMEDAVEKLLEAAEVHVVPDGDGEGIIELEIDIFKNDGGGFRVDCDWDDDEETEAQKRADSQEEIDDMVNDIVDTFIEFIKK